MTGEPQDTSGPFGRVEAHARLTVTDADPPDDDDERDDDQDTPDDDDEQED